MFRKAIIVFITLLLHAVIGNAQTVPGGVSSRLNLWLKANGNLTLTGIDVTEWEDQSGAAITGNFTAQPNQSGPQLPPTFLPAGVNFNPYVAFNLSGPQSLTSNNSFPGNTFLDNDSVTSFQVIRLVGGVVWLKWETDINGSTARFGFENASDRIRFDYPKAAGAPNGQNVGIAPVANKHCLATCFADANNSTIRLYGATDNIKSLAGVGKFNTTYSDKIIIGNNRNSDLPTTIDVAEVIVFGRLLTPAERNRVESYLAVKYGFTLNQTATYSNDYNSANSTVIWSRGNNVPFGSNITGIGRDDNSGLNQRQSRSVNEAGLVTIYNGGYATAIFPTLNKDNPNSFPDDNSFLLYGDNNLDTALNRCAEVDDVSFLRMNRVWKVQKTGTVNDVTLAVNASEMPAGIRNLLVSTDSAFTSGNTSIYRLDQAGNMLFKTLTFQDNTFFTFASDSFTVNVTSSTPLCEGSDIQLFANTAVGAGFTWTGPDNFTSTVKNPVITNAQAINSGSYSVTVTRYGCTATSSLSISINPVPGAPTVVSPVTYCQGDVTVPLNATGQDIRWYSVPAGGVGTPITPVPNTAGLGDYIWYASQTVGGCESPRVPVLVNIKMKPNAMVLVSRPTLCESDSITIGYFGNAPDTADFTWTWPVGAEVLEGSGKGPYRVQFDDPGTYTIRVQANNDGCIGTQAGYTVTVKQAPEVKMFLPSDACIGQPVHLGLSYGTLGIDEYNWNFAGGNIIYGATGPGPYGIKWDLPGQYQISLVATSEECKSDVDTATINIHALPQADIVSAGGADICSGDSVLLEAYYDPSYSYQWTPAQFFEEGGKSRVYGTIDFGGYVHLKVVSEYNCVSEDSIAINARPCCEVYFPDAFTPNNDGKNDRFRPITMGHHNLKSFRVMNRWGQVVFESLDERKGWDGSFNGVPQDLGVYFYFIDFNCSDGKRYQQKGQLTLLR